MLEVFIVFIICGSFSFHNIIYAIFHEPIMIWYNTIGYYLHMFDV